MARHNSRMQDFVSRESRYFRFSLGSLLASSLSGFIAGAIAVATFWALNAIIQSANAAF